MAKLIKDKSTKKANDIVKYNIITPLKHPEKKLRPPGDFLSKIINSIASPVFVKDDQHKFCLVNKALCSLLCLEVDQLIGKTGYEYFPEDQMKVFIAKDQEVFNTGRENINEEFLTDGRGNIRNIITSKTLYTDTNGNKFLVGIINDITERKYAEEELSKKIKELDSFFSVALDLLSIADTDGYFRRLNKQWQVTLGYSLKYLEGKKFFDFIHPDDIESTVNAVSELSAQKDVLNFVNRYRCKDGSYKWLEWRSRPVGNLIYSAKWSDAAKKKGPFTDRTLIVAVLSSLLRITFDLLAIVTMKTTTARSIPISIATTRSRKTVSKNVITSTMISVG